MMGERSGRERGGGEGGEERGGELGREGRTDGGREKRRATPVMSPRGYISLGDICPLYLRPSCPLYLRPPAPRIRGIPTTQPRSRLPRHDAADRRYIAGASQVVIYG